MFRYRCFKAALSGAYFIVSVLFLPWWCLAEEPQSQETGRHPTQVEYVGKFFDLEVPAENYVFIKGGLVLFGNKFGAMPKSLEEEEDCIWEQLLLSYEAHRRGIIVVQEEINNEVQNTLQADKVAFDWRKDKEAYEKWIKEKTNASSVLFENLIRHNLQIQKLREQVMESLTVTVSEKEARQEFLNEHNAISVELVEFSRKKEAQAFYVAAKANPKFWEQEKDKRPADFRRPGFVSLEFLMDIWMFPKDDLYRMIRMNIGSFYPPIHIYKGYGVCRILEVRPAETKEFKGLKDSYYAQLRERKKYAGLGEWFEGLKRQAKIIRYKKTP